MIEMPPGHICNIKGIYARCEYLMNVEVRRSKFERRKNIHFETFVTSG